MPNKASLREYDERKRALLGADDALPPLDLVDPTMLAGVPRPLRRWLINEWAPWHQTTALYGDGGTGKTLLAQMLCTSCAIGAPWLGLQVAQYRALGVFCEDSEDELHIRQDAINAALGVGVADIGAFRWISRLGRDNLLMTFPAGIGELTKFWPRLKEQALDLKAQCVVLDTAADMFGGNENDRGQVRQFIQAACTGLATAIDGAVILCAHPSRSELATGEGDGGATGWSNSGGTSRKGRREIIGCVTRSDHAKPEGREGGDSTLPSRRLRPPDFHAARLVNEPAAGSATQRR